MTDNDTSWESIQVGGKTVIIHSNTKGIKNTFQ